MAEKQLFLVCNSHLDPVWLWEWEEGLAETLGTFRTAADLCEEYGGFVFCHNEALLYAWVEEYEPALFKRIRKLVRKGRWHIMGGWYLQPDCNLPSAESFVRQILVGKRYFLDRFEVEPTVAVNLDPFGHTRGLVQILRRSGYDAYLFCRPGPGDLDLPGDDFIWVGYDSSEILAHRAPDHYNSERGRAAGKIRAWLERNPDRESGLLLWGIGDHGGGPSREDLAQIDRVQRKVRDREILHGTPEEYFAARSASGAELPRYSADLNPWAVGCYTTMAAIKQGHRRLENLLFSTEKLLTGAWLQGLTDYPHPELTSAQEDLLFCQFHDILPGSAIEPVERYARQRLDHGLEILSRLRARAFFALLAGQERPAEGEYPIFVANPHPWPVRHTVVAEFQPPEPNHDPDLFLEPELCDADGRPVPFQLEQESSNISTDQRKRLVFDALLEPSTMHRFTCRLNLVPRAPDPEAPPDDFTFTTDRAELTIDPRTGLIDRFTVDGETCLARGAGRLLVMADDPDPWGMKVRSFRELLGAFRLLSAEEGAEFAGIEASRLAPVRVIESGPVRTIVEALFAFAHSALALRYIIPAEGTAFELELRTVWMEKDRMLKLSLPTPFAGGRCLGQVAGGTEQYDRDGEECVAQKWVGLISGDGRTALAVINDGTYGFDAAGGELRLSLLRSAAHAGHPVTDGVPIVRQDRFTPRIDIGERTFRFRIEAGPAAELLPGLDRRALKDNERPMVLCASPPGQGRRPLPWLELSDEAVVLTAAKLAEDSDRVVLRLYNPRPEGRTTTVIIQPLDLTFNRSLGPYELQTLLVDPDSGEVVETDLLERELPSGDEGER